MMYQRNGLFFAVKAVVVLIFLALALPSPVFAQSNLAARVQIQGPDDEFGDVLLVRDGDDVIMYGLSGSVPPSSEVTISAEGINPITVRASFAGNFPVLAGNTVRLPGNIASAEITAVKAAGAGAVSGTVPLDITGEHVLQALRDYSEEVGMVLNGEKTTIDKGMPPHMLLDIVAETPADQPLVGKVLLTQRLIIQKSGDVVTLGLVDQFEGIPLSGTTPELGSFPPFSTVDVYGVPVSLDNPDIRLRYKVLNTINFIDGNFVSNGYFLPFTTADVNSSNKDTINEGVGSTLPFVTPIPGETLYLRVFVEGANGNPPKIFLAQVKNDVSAGIVGEVTVITNNESSPDMPGLEGLARIEGVVDPYGLVTAYADNDVNSEWISSVFAGPDGSFSLIIPPKADFDETKGEFGPYVPRQTVFLQIADPFGNESETLTQVATDNQLVADTPVAVELPNGKVQITGNTEPGSIIVITGRVRTDATQFYFANAAGKAGADGSYEFIAEPYFEYNVSITDQAGNQGTQTIPGDQNARAPENLAASSAFPLIRVTGQAEPFSSIISYGFDANNIPTDPQITDTLPPGAFFLGGANLEFPFTTAKADADGNFELFVPFSVSQIIYLQATDPAGNSSLFVPLELVDENGNPLGQGKVGFDNIVVTNNPVGVNDLITARTINIETGSPVSGLVVGAFAGVVSETDADVPFVDLLSDIVPVDNGGNFQLSVPDRSPITNAFLSEVYVVAFTQGDDGSLRDVGFTLIDLQDGLDRVGPRILFNPTSADIVVIDKPQGAQDIINISRIYPAGTGSSGDLPAGSLPFIVIIADNNDDDIIDVTDPRIEWITIKPLDAISFPGVNFFPKPGATGIQVGDNYWDPSIKQVVGHSVVFVALIDEVGNLSPNPIPVFLDVDTKDPDKSLITASGTAIFGDENAVEANATVTVYENSDKSGFIANTKAYENGGFAITGLSIAQEFVYIVSKDTAGNISNVVKVKVRNPIEAKPFIVADMLGTVHTPKTTLSAGDFAAAGLELRAISNVEGTVYGLYSDGFIVRVAGEGLVPEETDQLIVNGAFARDIEVISTNPFSAYVLFGNGVIATYGDAPFFGDLSASSTAPRLPLQDDRYFIDLNGNGRRDTEDRNGNGILDVSVGIGGVLITEDTGISGLDGTANNGILDAEPIIDLSTITPGFGWDIARDLELVVDEDDNVKGYVLMDGFGILWSFGNDINSQNVRPNATNGFSTQDVFVDFELIVENGQIVDFITLDGFGQLFALPSDQGGVLGAGPSTDPTIAGFLSADQYGIELFGFNIARDIEFSTEDSNGDGTVDWRDGWYILQGFGGIVAEAGASEIEDAPFLGLDIARDLEF